MIVTFLVMSRGGYTTKEKAFFALAWTPKATVQAALSGGWGVSMIVQYIQGPRIWLFMSLTHAATSPTGECLAMASLQACM